MPCILYMSLIALQMPRSKETIKIISASDVVTTIPYIYAASRIISTGGINNICHLSGRIMHQWAPSLPLCADRPSNPVMQKSSDGYSPTLSRKQSMHLKVASYGNTIQMIWLNYLHGNQFMSNNNGHCNDFYASTKIFLDVLSLEDSLIDQDFVV